MTDYLDNIFPTKVYLVQICVLLLSSLDVKGVNLLMLKFKHCDCLRWKVSGFDVRQKIAPKDCT